LIGLAGRCIDVRNLPMSQTVSLQALHPTQMTLGLREVARRMALYLALGHRQRADYIAQRIVPCVRGPAQRLFLIDRHHMCRALLEAGAVRVHISLVENFSTCTQDDFWRHMDGRGWVHPYDASGQRCAMTAIPGALEALADDPYRTLASVLRRENGYAKADLPFEEFAWANFLRHHIATELVRDDFAAAIAQAHALARSQPARHLPGWTGGR
jgi:hypothetical protein